MRQYKETLTWYIKTKRYYTKPKCQGGNTSMPLKEYIQFV